MLNIYKSEEFIQFQKGLSPLAKQLTALFKEGTDLRDDTVGSISVKITTVLTWFKKDGGPRLAKIISDYLGIKTYKIKLSKTCDFGYAVQINVGDPYGLNASMIFDRMSGKPVNSFYDRIIKEYKLYKPTYEELKRISESYEEHTGKFRDVKLNNGKDVSLKLYFDPYSAFFLKDTCHEKLEYLTPEEVAAVIVHECGHAVSLLLKATDLWFVSTANNQLIRDFLATANMTEKIKYLRVMSGKSSNFDIIKAALDVCEKVMVSNDDPTGRAAFWPLVFMLFGCAVSLCISPIDLAFTAIKSCFDDCVNYNPDKLSDLHNASKNIKYTEQLADSYVVRHGLGQYLSSALVKASSMPEYASVYTRKSRLVWYASKLCQIYYSLIFHDFSENDEHENIVDRQKSIANDSLKVFKTLDMSDDLKKFYIDDYEDQMLWVSKVPTTLKAVVKIHIAKRFISYVTTTPIHLLVGGRFNAEYDKLFKEVESVMSNDLAYRAAKLELLAKK